MVAIGADPERAPIARAIVRATARVGDALRKALLDANAAAGADTITFNIAGSGVHTIAPLAQLPFITSPVTIDGYSQPGSSMNSSATGTNAVLLIELSGANSANEMESEGLVLLQTSSPSTIQGLVINEFHPVNVFASVG